MIKKYHIADIITASRIILASTLVGVIWENRPPDIAIWIIVACELGDALDGIFARKYHYPNDGKYLWWRKYAPEIDQVADIYTGVLALVYYIKCVNFQLGVIILISGLIIGLTIQTYAIWLKYLFSEKVKRRLILTRRYLYLLAIVVVVTNLTMSTSWLRQVKIACLLLGTTVGIILIIVKRNRLTQVKTPL